MHALISIVACLVANALAAPIPQLYQPPWSHPQLYQPPWSHPQLYQPPWSHPQLYQPPWSQEPSSPSYATGGTSKGFLSDSDTTQFHEPTGREDGKEPANIEISSQQGALRSTKPPTVVEDNFMYHGCYCESNIMDCGSNANPEVSTYNGLLCV